MKENVKHPKYYGGSDNVYEAIKVIEVWGLDFCLGNVIKYISRAGKKDKSKLIQDLEKASWYLNREIENLKNGEKNKLTNENDVQYTAKQIVTENKFVVDKYKFIFSREDYDKLHKSGLFFEIYPELTGIWLLDKLNIGNNKDDNQ